MNNVSVVLDKGVSKKLNADEYDIGTIAQIDSTINSTDNRFWMVTGGNIGSYNKWTSLRDGWRDTDTITVRQSSIQGRILASGTKIEIEIV